MLLDKNLTPVSKLSGSFMKPPSPMHLQFAYYQSSLVVEFLVDQYGIDALKALLVELANGLSINDAIGRTMRPIETIDEQFAQHARELASAFGKDADWTRPSEDDEAEPAVPSENNLWALIDEANTLVKSKSWKEAQVPLEHLIKLGVVYGERDGPLEQLAMVYRELGKQEQELSTLQQLNTLSSDSLPTISRLIELARTANDWQSVLKYANKWLAIQPLLPAGHEAVAEAAEKLNHDADAATSLLALSKLQPVDPAGIDLRLAKAQHKLGQQQLAKRSVLRALEYAPRYREAHRMLLEINDHSSGVPGASSEATQSEK
jgi:tetratricopeptide (TPR) repeat protein